MEISFTSMSLNASGLSLIHVWYGFLNWNKMLFLLSRLNDGKQEAHSQHNLQKIY